MTAISSWSVRDTEFLFDLPPLSGSAHAVLVRHLVLTEAYEELVCSGEMTMVEFEEHILEPARVLVDHEWWAGQRTVASRQLGTILADAAAKIRRGRLVLLGRDR